MMTPSDASILLQFQECQQEVVSAGLLKTGYP